MISWMKMLPVAKIMFDGLKAVLSTTTDKSVVGKIHEEEIDTVLKSSVESICTTLGPIVIRRGTDAIQQQKNI